MNNSHINGVEFSQIQFSYPISGPHLEHSKKELKTVLYLRIKNLYSATHTYIARIWEYPSRGWNPNFLLEYFFTCYCWITKAPVTLTFSRKKGPLLEGTFLMTSVVSHKMDMWYIKLKVPFMHCINQKGINIGTVGQTYNGHIISNIQCFLLPQLSGYSLANRQLYSCIFH